MPGNILVVVDIVVNKTEEGPFFMVIPFWERKEQKVLTENKHVYKSTNNVILHSNSVKKKKKNQSNGIQWWEGWGT